MSKTFSVRLIRSKIGCTRTQLDTLRVIGLNKIGKAVKVKDNSANRGQVLKVQHLVSVQLEK